jgi:glycosyltransferase involved in cell wall biosynthesis
MNISFICPSRNNLKYLKWSIASIIKNKGDHQVEICVWDDFSDDGTEDWLKEFQHPDIKLKWSRNAGPTRLGHTILYDKIINELATNELCIIWHADMYLCPEALDSLEELMFQDERVDIGYDDYWTNRTSAKNRICSLTRIEPPLHPPGVEKVVEDCGTEPENFDEEKLLNLAENLRETAANYFRITRGVFAPWAFWKDEFLDIGGHDILFAPQSKEDSDIWNRFLLKGTDFYQTWRGYVYHMTCRGSRFNPFLTVTGKNSEEWGIQNLKSSRNFVRKWGHFVRHDEYLYPYVPHKYDIRFVIKNCDYRLLYELEPWCSYVSVDDLNIVKKYIDSEQKETLFDLEKKFYDDSNRSVTVFIDGETFNQSDMPNIMYLSDILTENGVLGDFYVGNIRLNIRSLETYEEELIINKNEN